MTETPDVTKLSIKKLLKRGINPYNNPMPWGCEITKEDVQKCIAANTLLDHNTTWHLDNYRENARRIAYLANVGWTDPISVDVGIPDAGFTPVWPIDDGNHRLAAAILQGRPYIEAHISGQTDIIEELVYDE